MTTDTMSVEFRGTIVEIVYRKIADDDVFWAFAEDGLNDLILTGRERQDIWREALNHSGRK